MEETTTISFNENDFHGNTEDSLLGKHCNKTVNDTDAMFDQCVEDNGAKIFDSLPDLADFDFMFDLNFDYKTEVITLAFGFERRMYLYVWVAFVILTVLVNIPVICILLQKKMRSVTNILLVAIAISDSMTGLVKLPIYIMVYRKAEVGMALESLDSYILSKSLCHAFMISIFFFSQSFHTISIWLTLLLGIQRYISIAYPFKTQVWFTATKTAIVFVLICVFAPVLHVYHLVHVHDKTIDGICGWTLEDETGAADAQIWVTLFLRHLIPCFVLTITTVLFIRNLNKNSFQPTNSMRNIGNQERSGENRRVSKIVMAIVVLFLIPEVPYGLFLLYSVCLWNKRSSNDAKRNAAIHVGYEIILILSYHLNFYIYTCFSKRFRFQLLKTFGTFSSRLNKLCLSARVPSSNNGRNIGGTTKNESLPNVQGGTGHGNEINESVV